jgi:hypothetical protein
MFLQKECMLISRDISIFLRALIPAIVVRFHCREAPLEMGRHELYAELPFVAVLGLQKKERSLSLACSNLAAELDNEESENYLISTTGKGMDQNEKEKRVRQMSVVLMDEMEGMDGVNLTLPLVVAVLIASLYAFNCESSHTRTK